MGWEKKEEEVKEGGEKENKEVCVFCSLCLCVLN